MSDRDQPDDEFADAPAARATSGTMDSDSEPDGDLPSFDAYGDEENWSALEDDESLGSDPEWAEERLKNLNIWLDKVNNVLNGSTVQNEKLALDINEFVGWTYLYRFMDYEKVAEKVNDLVNYLMPQGVFQSEIDNKSNEGEEGGEKS